MDIARILREYEKQIMELNRNNIIQALEKEDLYGEIANLKIIIKDFEQELSQYRVPKEVIKDE